MTTDKAPKDLVRRAERSLRNYRMVRGFLLAALIYSLVLSPSIGGETAGGVVLMVVCAIWVLLSIQARGKSSQTSAAGQLIAAGQPEQAKAVLAETLGGLCVHKQILLTACHNLAVIFQKQKQWLAAWQMCELVRNSVSKRSGEIRVLCEAVRADCSLAMNNLAGAYESLSILSGIQLSVAERLSVLQTEIIYGIRVGNSKAVMADLPAKVVLAGLLPTEQAGAAHASLALAAHLAGQTSRRNWLWNKALLYCPAEQLLWGQPWLEPVARAVTRG